MSECDYSEQSVTTVAGTIRGAMNRDINARRTRVPLNPTKYCLQDIHLSSCLTVTAGIYIILNTNEVVQSNRTVSYLSSSASCCGSTKDHQALKCKYF